MVAAVAVVLAVRLVVLAVIGNDVVQREPVMSGDEVDRGPRPPPTTVELAGRSGEPGRHGGGRRFRLPERARDVTILVVPLGPTRRELAHLIAAGADVPGFGDQLDAGEHRVLPAGVEKAAALVEAVVLARQDRGEVEAEAVHVHLGDPVAQAVGDHLQHPGMADVDGIAGAGVVHVAPAVVRQQPVVAAVVGARKDSVAPRSLPSAV